MNNDELLRRCEERLRNSQIRERMARACGDDKHVRKEQALQYMNAAFRAQLRLEMGIENQQEELN